MSSDRITRAVTLRRQPAARMEKLMKRSLETQLRMAYALSGTPNLLPERKGQ